MTTPTPQKGRIFISYRRADSAGYAGRIYDRLSAHFGKEAVFMDVDTIEAGLDFVEVLQNAVQSCDVLVALIGQSWLNIKDGTGKRRLDNPEDFVRIEIAAALDRDIRVIPVLVDGVPMPHSTELPRNLKPLARRNALQVNHHSFNADAHRLISQMELAFKAAEDSKVLKAQALKEERARAQRQAEINRLQKAADLAISLKDWNLAQEKLSDVLKLDANHMDAQSKLDIVQRKISELEQEKEIAEKAAREKEKREQKEREEKARIEKEAREKAVAEELARLVAEQKAREDRSERERKEAEEKTLKEQETRENAEVEERTRLAAEQKSKNESEDAGQKTAAAEAYKKETLPAVLEVQAESRFRESHKESARWASRLAKPKWLAFEIGGIVILVFLGYIFKVIIDPPPTPVPPIEVLETFALPSASVTSTENPLTLVPTDENQTSKTITPVSTEPSNSSILFFEDFEDGKAQSIDADDGWEVIVDETGNSVYSIDASTNGYFPTASFGNNEWRDYVVELRVKILEFKGRTVTYIAFRDSERGQYEFGLEPMYKKFELAFWQRDGESWNVLDKHSFNIVTGEWYSIRVEVKNTVIKAYVEDNLVASATDTQLSNGTLSLIVGPNTHAHFDDIQVLSLDK